MIPALLFHPREADIIKGIDIASTLEPVETHFMWNLSYKTKTKEFFLVLLFLRSILVLAVALDFVLFSNISFTAFLCSVRQNTNEV